MYGEQPEPGFFESIFNLVGSMNFWLVILAIFILSSSIVITSGKRARIIEQFGKPLSKARLPGLSLKLPWPIQAVVGEVNLQLQNAKANVSVKTKDNAFMELPVDVQYRVINDAESAVRAHYELEKPEEQIVNYVLNNVKNTAGGLEMQELYSNRDDIETSAQAALSKQFEKYGYEIVNVLVDEPMPSDEVRDSFNRVIASMREKEAAQNVADAKRIELVGIATAEKESKKLQGEGMSSMREAIASGMKTAMETLTGSGLTVEQALGLMMDTNRLDTIATASANGNMVLVDMEGSTDMAKTIGAVQAAGKHGPRAVAEAS